MYVCHSAGGSTKLSTRVAVFWAPPHTLARVTLDHKSVSCRSVERERALWQSTRMTRWKMTTRRHRTHAHTHMWNTRTKSNINFSIVEMTLARGNRGFWWLLIVSWGVFFVDVVCLHQPQFIGWNDSIWGAFVCVCVCLWRGECYLFAF